MAMQLVVLGSGQDGGSPQVGTPVGVGTPRSASSLALSLPGGEVVLLDASPDIRTQYHRMVRAGMTAAGPNPFDAVFVTHGHIGHYLGLAHFGREVASTSAMPVHAPQSLLTFLGHNQPWRSLFDLGHLEGFSADTETAWFGTTSITAVPVPHRAEHSSTVAFSVSDQSAARLLYLPDIDRWEDWEQAHETIGSHEVAFLDATFGHPDELPSRDLTGIPHPFVIDTIERFAPLTDSHRLILTHLNHSNSVADPSSHIAALAREAGFEVANDGMTITWDP